MDPAKSKRRSMVCCPNCGRMEVKARLCDIEMRCRRCHYKFEAVIGPKAKKAHNKGQASTGESDKPNAK